MSNHAVLEINEDDIQGVVWTLMHIFYGVI